MIATFRTTEKHLFALVNEEEARSGCRIEVITARSFAHDYIAAMGTKHNVMRLIGLFADHGEDCLIEAKGD